MQIGDKVYIAEERKTKPNDGLILDDLVEPLNNLLEKDEWKPIYRQEPIVREN